jgi:glc operon protein GlcG
MASRLICTPLLALVIAAASVYAHAASLPTRPNLTLDAARAVVSAAEAKAAAEHWPCVVAVVDSDGLPLIIKGMDDASVPAGVYLAPGKARTAALFRRRSSALEESINGHLPAAETARGFVEMAGGPADHGGSPDRRRDRSVCRHPPARHRHCEGRPRRTGEMTISGKAQRKSAILLLIL